MKKLMNIRPALYYAVSIVAAVFSSYFIFVKNSAAIGFLIAGTILFAFCIVPITVCAFLRKDKLKNAIFFSLFAIIFSFTAFVRFYSITEKFVKADIGDAYLTVCGKVDSVENFDGGKSVVLSSVEYSGRLKGENGYKILVNVYGKSQADVGDIIKFFAVVQDKSLFYEGRFCATDVARGIKYYASVNSDDIVIIGNRKTPFETVNVAIRDKLAAGLNEDEFAVAYALLLGNSEYSESDILHYYNQAGVAHIFAVSGLHIGFLAAAIGYIFKKTKINPFISAAVICAFLFFYSGVCGFTASSLRAAVMCGVSLFVYAAGGRYDGLSSVSLAAIIILLVSPVQLFCAGFVLSFSVVIGIMLAAKPIGRIFRFLPEKVSAAVGAVIAAWLFSAPILIIFFGKLSLFAVASNLIFIPVVGVIYIFLLLSAILSFVSPAVFLFVPNIVLSIVNFAVKIIDYSPFIIGGITLTAATLFYYASLIVPTGIFNLKTITKTVLSVSFTLAFVLSTAFYNVRENSTVKAYFIGSYGICAAVIENKTERTVIVSYAVRGFPVNRIERLYARNGVKITDVIVLSDIDINLTITRLYALSYIRSVYFYEGDKNIHEKSFKDTKFTEIGLNDMHFSGYTVRLTEKGRAAEITAGNKSALVFAEFKSDRADFSGSDKHYDIIAAYDYTERIAATYDCSLFLSYRNSPVFTDAERSGNYLFKFD